jgi:alpha-ketoglutarate-dependent taurine dioxygenase
MESAPSNANGLLQTRLANAGPRRWRRDDLAPEDWLVALPERCWPELDEVASAVRAEEPSTTSLRAERFELSGCGEVMTEVRRQLTDGIGFAVLDRVPVERYGVPEKQAIAWLLAQLLGQVVAQKWDGTRLYDVRDSGKALAHGVRRSVTNLEQHFHTDGGWLSSPPHFVGLFCVQPAASGGHSRCASLVSAHDTLGARAPELLERLYAPFWWDRQAEHDPADAPWSEHPVFETNDGMLVARYYDDYVHKGHALKGVALDETGAAALAAMRQIVEAPDSWLEFRLAAGQFQYINNRQVAHSRTAFQDDGAKRHLIRLWNRDEGSPGLEGWRLCW